MNYLNLLLLADTTVAPISSFLNDKSSDLAIKVQTAPYDQVIPILLDSTHKVWESQPDVLVVWTLPEKAIPAFNEVLNFKMPNMAKLIQEVDEFASRLERSANRAKTVLVTSWALPPHYRWIQSLTLRHNTGVANILMQMNLRLAEKIDGLKNIIFLDTQYWYASVQGLSHDPQLYALGKIYYSRSFFKKAANEIKAVLRAIRGLSKKLVICDLDNTLWGGIIGDDGPENIKLGGVDPIGESFVGFQKALKALKDRGILLAICSKNDEGTAMDMIENHPEMILRREDFSAIRINWKDKAENILEMVKELNLGFQSVVFLDDNPTERERVKRALPEVFTPDLPLEIVEYPVFIHSLDCFETLSITDEDRNRTELYLQDQDRKKTMQNIESIEDWLNSLNITVEISPLSKANLARAVQLLNKTNQFNMATRRLNESEYFEWSEIPGNYVYTFRVADRFGDLGLTGLVSAVLQSNGAAEIVDFVMSCRVMGKMVENSFLATVIQLLYEAGASTIRAEFKRTAKNKPFWDFIVDKYLAESDFLLDDMKIFVPTHIKIFYEGGK